MMRCKNCLYASDWENHLVYCHQLKYWVRAERDECKCKENKFKKK